MYLNNPISRPKSDKIALNSGDEHISEAGIWT